MKLKSIVFVIVAAAITLSFTFVSVKPSEKTDEKNKTEKHAAGEPIGGFLLTDKI